MDVRSKSLAADASQIMLDAQHFEKLQRKNRILSNAKDALQRKDKGIIQTLNKRLTKKDREIKKLNEKIVERDKSIHLQ